MRNQLLCIDDSPRFCEYVGEMAKRVGFDFTSLTDPGLLREAYRPNFSMIVVDLCMPRTDGIATLRQLAEMDYRGSLVLVSGDSPELLGSAKRVADLNGLEVEAVLQKPIRARELLALLQEYEAHLSTPPELADTQPFFMEPQVKAGIREGQMVVHYQPKIDMHTLQVAGVEALVRWEHPDAGLVYPVRFLPSIESSQVGQELTDAVLKEVLDWLNSRRQRRMPSVQVSVNLPGIALRDLTFPDRAAALVDVLDLQRNQLTFELVEDAMVVDQPRAVEILSRLRLKGFNLALDDFGTGSASMEQLANLPTTELKIDKKFVLAYDESRRARKIVDHSIGLATDLGLQVTAEGVETMELFHHLRSLGCDQAQGFLFARAKTTEDLEAWMAKWRHQVDEQGL